MVMEDRKCESHVRKRGQLGVDMEWKEESVILDVSCYPL